MIGRELESQVREAEQATEEYRAKCEMLEERLNADQFDRKKLEQELADAQEHSRRVERTVREQSAEHAKVCKQKDEQVASLTQALDQLRRELSEGRSFATGQVDQDASFSAYKKRTEVMSN